MIAAIMVSVEMALKRIPDEYGDYTFFSIHDTWVYHGVFDEVFCSQCQSKAVPFTYAGSSLRRIFPYLEITDVNRIEAQVHPNCRCYLERSSPLEEPDEVKEPKINPPVNFLRTGHKVKLNVARNMERSPKVGTRFAQDIEPTGEYMIHDELEGKFKLPNWKYGVITFNNPLILPWVTTGHGGWKTALSIMFDNKTGKELEDAVKAKGYDAIITVDGDHYSEIVNLGERKFLKEKD
jgi:hypothetical protein